MFSNMFQYQEAGSIKLCPEFKIFSYTEVMIINLHYRQATSLGFCLLPLYGYAFVSFKFFSYFLSNFCLMLCMLQTLRILELLCPRILMVSKKFKK